MAENYFDILGVGRDADDETVKQAFRDLAKTYHPDRNPGDAEAEQQFKRINTAYDALRDAERREAYIEWLHFVETRERSKMAQWGRLAALVAVLIFGPVLLYLTLASSDTVPPPKGSAIRPPVVEQSNISQTSAQQSVPAAESPQAKQPAQPVPSQGMHLAPQPVPITEATKSPRGDRAKPGQSDAGNRSDRWEPSSEQAPPATTEALPQSTGGAPNASVADNSPGANAVPPVRIAKSGDGDPAHPAPPASGFPSGDANAAPTAQGAGGAETFSDCDNCPSMTPMSNDQRYVAAKDRNGRMVPREAVAISKEAITVGHWNACVAEGACPRYVTASQNDPQRPVQDVSARDASTFIDWLSRKSGHSYWLLADSDGGAVREEYANANCGTPGWEWMEDGCFRRPNTYQSFRVMRSIRADTD